MKEEKNNLNPFAEAKTLEEREKVWNSLKGLARPVAKEEAERLIEVAVRLQTSKH